MFLKSIRIVLLLAVAQPVNSSELREKVMYAGAAATVGGAIGIGTAVLYQNYKHKESYYKALALKVDGFFPDDAPASREFVEKFRNKYATDFKKELVEEERKGLLKRVSPLVEVYTRYFFFRNGIPIRGDSTIRYDEEKMLNARISSGLVDGHFSLDNYCFIMNSNLHDAVAKALNPFYRLRNSSIDVVLADTDSDYTINATISPTLMLDLYKATLLHEGQHVLDQVHGQVVVGKDVTEKQNEINADNNIQDQNLLSAQILNSNLAKLQRIYFTWARNNILKKFQEVGFLQKYSQLYSDCLRAEVGPENYHPEDFHPCEDERIALLKDRWEGSKRHREVPVTVYYQRPGEEKKEHRRLVLREESGWEVRLF